MSSTENGLLMIADISGYTMFLSESELDHARGTLETLLEVLVDHTRPPLIISRLAGDAVISYALDERLPRGQTFVEVIEDSYVAFRKAIELMVLNNSCKCRACANVSTLDLKFLVHYGSFALQHIDAREELVGTDVNLIHRLLKNSVADELGTRAYTLYTNAAIHHMGLEQITLNMPEHVEHYEHIGRVETRVHDMHPVWERKREATQIKIDPKDIGVRTQTMIAMPPHVVWDYMVTPEFRKTILGSDRQEIQGRSDGRVAPGSVYQCFHGDRVFLETILEYQPFEHMVTEDRVMMGLTGLLDHRLSATREGTQLSISYSKPKGPFLGRTIFNLTMPVMRPSPQERLEMFRDRIEADLDSLGATLTNGADVPKEALREAATASLSGRLRPANDGPEG